MKLKSYLRIFSLCGLALTVCQTMAHAASLEEASKPSAPTSIKASKITVSDVRAKLALFDITPAPQEQENGRANIDNFLSGKSDTLVGFDARNNRHR